VAGYAEKAVAEMECLHCSTVKDLDEFYMQEQRDCQHPVPLTMMGYLSAKGIAAGALSAIWAGNAPSGLAVKAAG
jgi:hypothetical protein